MKTRSARRFDRIITVQQASAATNDHFGETLTWFTLKQVWADVEWPRGSESEQTDQKTATTKVNFTVRYDSDLHDERLRIQLDGRTYDIKTVLEVGRRRYLKIETELYR